MRTLMTLLTLNGLTFIGCLITDDGGVICTEVFVYGVKVALTHADTGEAITGATLTLTEGDYSEPMQELSPGHYAGAGERAGTYTLTVEVDGFETQTIGDIVVDADECHVIPVNLDVELTLM